MTETSGGSAEAESITFYSRCPPGLDAGSYALRVDQTIEDFPEHEDDPPDRQARFGTDETDGFRFSVFGPRFALDPADVYSVHPPRGHVGNFAETLPHIVFTRRTLPWERHPKAGVNDPWLALIVLQPSDFTTGKNGAEQQAFPPVVTRQVADLLKPEGGILPPILGDGDPLDWLDAHEQASDLCTTIDLPAVLFRDVAPRLSEAVLLTHVRQVDTGHKETASLMADGWFSVAVANRLPEAPMAHEDTTVENRVFLISIEGLTDYLDPDWTPAHASKVRVPVLAHWSFACKAAAGTGAAMASLKARKLEVPGPDGTRPQDDYLRSAFSMGYTALNHATRRGERTVSWYRGPLSPVAHPRESDTVFRPAADAALRYSPQDGMMDVSYGAAYQLGRLLALQDRHFAIAIQSFRQDIRRQVNRVMGRDGTRRQMAATEDATRGAVDEQSLFHAYLQDLDAESETTIGGNPADGQWRPAEARPLSTEESAAEDGGLRLSSDFDLRIPAPIVRWLSRLMLLYRVPFAYLVPDERMLQPDCIAFFEVDADWLKCLAEGACSVGRSSGRDELAERTLRNAFLDFALHRSRDIRPQKLVPGRPDPQGDIAADAERAPPNWPLTGFILRSPVVEALQGIEMRAWQTDRDGTKAPLDALRIDRLAPDIMLCIFDGSVDRIEMKQPPEALHFGVTVARDGTMSREAIRHLTETSDHKAGSQIEGASVAVEDRGWPRVIDITKLAKDVADVAQPDRLTAAGFAVQMVQSAVRRQINRTTEE